MLFHRISLHLELSSVFSVWLGLWFWWRSPWRSSILLITTYQRVGDIHMTYHWWWEHWHLVEVASAWFLHFEAMDCPFLCLIFLEVSHSVQPTFQRAWINLRLPDLVFNGLAGLSGRHQLGNCCTNLARIMLVAWTRVAAARVVGCSWVLGIFWRSNLIGFTDRLVLGCKEMRVKYGSVKLPFTEMRKMASPVGHSASEGRAESM